MLVVKSLICFLDSVRALKLLGYIDPGTGSLVFQAIAASLISGALFVRGARDRIIWLFTGGWRVKPQPDVTTLPDATDLTVEVSLEAPRNAA
jgi:hypothetical protein